MKSNGTLQSVGEDKVSLSMCAFVRFLDGERIYLRTLSVQVWVLCVVFCVFCCVVCCVGVCVISAHTTGKHPKE